MRRASPMPPEERRAAIVGATRPLVLRYGADVSTRQIAEACDLAEGTLFRVFPNKDAIIHAAVDDLLDPQPLVAAIAAIDRTLPLADQLTAAVELLLESGRQVVGVFSVLHPKRPDGVAQREPKHPAHNGENKAVWAERKDAPVRALTDLLAPHADELLVNVPAAVSFVRGVVFAATHPLTSDDHLDGVTLSALLNRALIKEQ